MFKLEFEITPRHLIGFIAAACAGLFALTVVAARAQTAPAIRLKPIATVESDVVRLSDLIDGAGAQAEVAVFGAPMPGASGMISTARIVTAARDHGLGEIETSGLSSVAVRRLGRRISAEEIARAVAEALVQEQKLSPDTEIELNSGQMEVTVESSATEPVTIRQLTYSASGRVEATFVVPGSRALEINPGKVVASVLDVMRVPVLSKAVLKGDIVSASDIAIERRRRSDMGADVYLDPAKIIGNAAKRALPKGLLVREADIQRPEAIEKGASVTMSYEQPGIQLTMRGRAITGGAVGDVIQIQNINSKKTVEAVITGPNRAAVTGTVLPQKTARNGTTIQ